MLVRGVKQEIWLLSSGFSAGESSSTDSPSMAAILIQRCSASKLAGHCQNYAPCAQSVHTRGHVAATYPGTCTRNIFMCVQMLWFCPCYMSPLHVPATCPLSVYYTSFCRCSMSLQHVPATWPLVSAHLKIAELANNIRMLEAILVTRTLPYLSSDTCIS